MRIIKDFGHFAAVDDGIVGHKYGVYEWVDGNWEHIVSGAAEQNALVIAEALETTLAWSPSATTLNEGHTI